VITWFVRNPVAANILMVSIIVFGLYSVINRIPLETFPAFEQDIVNVTVDYLGATPQEVEQGVSIRIEDAIADLPGIERIYSDSAEGRSLVRVEILKQYDTTKLLNQIKTRVDKISSFPEEAERPVVEQLIRTRDVITVVVAQEATSNGSQSNDQLSHETSRDEVTLRTYAEKIRDEIRNIPNVTQVAMGGIRPWEISINVPESSLRQYDLTLDDIAKVVRSASRDIPGGTIKTESGEILVRALGQAYKKNEFDNIRVISRRNGTSIRLGEIATINDGFNEDPLYSNFDDQHAAFINVTRVGDQNAIELATAVKDYIAERAETLPDGLSLSYWKDSSKIVKARLDTLSRSLIQGIALVLLLLALFLRPDLAFWVSVGVPISFLGALAVMPYFDVTLNLVSMFGFILVLGIVVDDAIVTGENVYSHLQKTGDGVRSAIEGTKEISVPVTFGVLTTVAAFLPLLMIDGIRGKIFAQIPLVVIPVLIFSLIESKLVLPSHLQYMKLRKDTDKLGLLTRFQRKISQGLEYFIKHFYRTFLDFTLNWRYLTLAVFITTLVIVVSIVISGRYKYTFFPRIQSEIVSATIEMPEGTAIETTQKYVDKMVSAAKIMQEKYIEPTAFDNSESTNNQADQDMQELHGKNNAGEKLIQHILVTVGSSGSRPRDNATGKSNVAMVTFETIPPEKRTSTITTKQLVAEWRNLIGPIPGVKELSFRAELGRGGEPINIQLKGNNFDELNAIAQKVKLKLGEFDGLFDIQNSYEGGKEEVQLRIRPEAEQLGLNLSTLGLQVRHAVYGAEAQRIQRNQSEIKVMVRAPKEERYALSDLQNLRIRTSSRAEIPLSEVADIDVGRGSATITRVDRQRIINITSDLNKERVDANAVVSELKEWLPGVLKDYPDVSFDLEGEQREQRKFGRSLAFGFGFALLTIYVLLAIPFASYTQPLMVMSIIPFSVIGAIGGHAIMDLSLSISSIMGLLALIGVVVNDSLVLVDYTNKLIKQGIPVAEAIRIAGSARFRPILLTSLTTFAGLTPLIMEKSTQAQFLIPMAVSLGFGILFATLITLVLIPTFYLIVEDIKLGFLKVKRIFFRLMPQSS